MVKFRIVGLYQARRNTKKWLNEKAQKLPYYFTFEQIEEGTFSKSVMKRLKTAYYPLTKIKVMAGRGYLIYIQVINKKELSITKKKESKLKGQCKKELREIMKDNNVKKFCKLIGKVAKTQDMRNMKYHHFQFVGLENIEKIIRDYLK